MEEKKDEKRLYCTSGGCTAKLGMGALKRILERLPVQQNEALLVGFDTCDDAAVYRLDDRTALLHTLDFFPPMLDDPFLFGQIAAANALSDIYAMGGDVQSALNIVCFPERADLNLLGEMLRGGQSKVAEAGGVLCGGHSIVDAGVKYGLSVTGTVHPQKIWRNVGARTGDRLILTKPLGVGIVMAARTAGEAREEHIAAAVKCMCTLNRTASETLRAFDVHAATDVTGFGLLGHLSEMTHGALSARLDAARIPALPGALEYAAAFLLTGAAQKNRNALAGKVELNALPFAVQELLYDAQTSGGLLAALAEDEAQDALAALRKNGVPAQIIGTVLERREDGVEVYG